MPCKIFSFSPCHPGLQTQYAREMGNLAICLSIKAQQRRIKWEGKEKEICRQLEIEVFRSLVDILLFRSSWMCCMANSEVAKPVYHCFHSYWCALFIWSAFMHNSVFKSEVSVVCISPADRLAGQSQSGTDFMPKTCKYEVQTGLFLFLLLRGLSALDREKSKQMQMRNNLCQCWHWFFFPFEMYFLWCEDKKKISSHDGLATKWDLFQSCLCEGLAPASGLALLALVRQGSSYLWATIPISSQFREI